MVHVHPLHLSLQNEVKGILKKKQNKTKKKQKNKKKKNKIKNKNKKTKKEKEDRHKMIYGILFRATRARHMLAVVKKLVIKVNSKFYLYHKIKK